MFKRQSIAYFATGGLALVLSVLQLLFGFAAGAPQWCDLLALSGVLLELFGLILAVQSLRPGASLSALGAAAAATCWLAEMAGAVSGWRSPNPAVSSYFALLTCIVAVPLTAHVLVGIQTMQRTRSNPS